MMNRRQLIAERIAEIVTKYKRETSGSCQDK
jgi:hypothetical protein